MPSNWLAGALHDAGRRLWHFGTLSADQIIRVLATDARLATHCVALAGAQDTAEALARAAQWIGEMILCGDLDLGIAAEALVAAAAHGGIPADAAVCALQGALSGGIGDAGRAA